jgi:L-2,4-diaminobutyric acid acetyltransferase
VSALIAACPPLDANSAYCNLLQCSHFAETCVVAADEDALVGWVSGYVQPDQADTLFIWQVAVAQSARGSGLAGRMLSTLLTREACKAVRRLTTTITPENRASWALFSGLARSLDTQMGETPWLLRGRHLPPDHATEHIVTIGPFGPVDA